MPSPENVRVRLQRLEERLARLRATRDRMAAHASRTERTRDTRRKIVIGGTVLAALDHDGIPSLRSHAELVRWLDARLRRPQDRRAFDLPVVPGE